MDYYQRDFLTMGPNDVRVPPDLIVMNPPYSLAFEFVKHALSLCPNVIALVNAHFFGSRRRVEFLREHRPKWIAWLSPRPSFDGKGSDSIEYAWVGWERDPSGIGPIEFWTRKQEGGGR
jgi:hypothetical protein